MVADILENNHQFPDEKLHADHHNARKVAIISGVFVLLAGLVAAMVALYGTLMQPVHADRSAQEEFMRSERSAVYGEYLEASLRYQNAITAYASTIPDTESQQMDPETERPAYAKLTEAKERYLNTRTRARLLQDEAAVEYQKSMDEVLYGTHNRLSENVELILGDVPGRVSNQEMKDVVDQDFANNLATLRDKYVDAVRDNFFQPHVSRGSWPWS